MPSSVTLINASGLSSSSDDLSMSQKALYEVALMLVDESSARDFISILQCMVDGPSMVFGNFRPKQPLI